MNTLNGYPDLSVIVPVFNESASLPKLFSGLAKQKNVRFEVIIADGNSLDKTRDTALELAKKYSFPAKAVTSQKGRGLQMNAGAAVSRGETILFLHADSSFSDNLALSQGMAELSNEISSRGTEEVAGRFSLKFCHENGYSLSRELSLAYYYYENKARLNRVECINGDQGVLLRRSFWEKAGPFNETLPFLEDKAFAEKVSEKGMWKLLSPSILTSSRRFSREGLKERQTLNALIMNFFSTGRVEFITGLPDVYKNQDKTKKMKMYPFFRQIRAILSGFSLIEQLTFWYQTGSYILNNSWQIALYLDVKREFLRDRIKGERPLLEFHEKVVTKLLLNPLLRFITTVLVWSWFHFRYLTKK